MAAGASCFLHPVELFVSARVHHRGFLEAGGTEIIRGHHVAAVREVVQGPRAELAYAEGPHDRRGCGGQPEYLLAGLFDLFGGMDGRFPGAVYPDRFEPFRGHDQTQPAATGTVVPINDDSR
jgi:hypothetical protein